MIWQYAVIAVLAVASVLYTVRKLAPRLVTRLQARVSAALTRPQRGTLLQAIGRRLSPADVGGDCGSGCGSCGSCGTSGAAPLDEAPLTFHSRK